MRRQLLSLAGAFAAVVPLMMGAFSGFAGAHTPAGDGHHAITSVDSGRGLTQKDTIGDGEFSQSCVVDDRNPDPYLGGFGVPPTGAQAVDCNNKVPETDIQEHGLRYIPATGAGALKNPLNPATTVPTIEAKWTFGKAWPAKTQVGPIISGDRHPETITGLSADITFRNPYLEINDLWPVCDNPGSLDPNNPNPANRGPKTQRPSGMGSEHWLDQHHLFIGINYSSEATSWDGLIQWGYYSAWADDGFNHVIGDFETNRLYETPGGGAEDGNGTFYFYGISGNTVTVRIPATYIEESSVCLKTFDPSKNNNIQAGPLDPEASTGINLPNDPRSSDNGTVGGYEYHPFALSNGARANAPASVVDNVRFVYPAGKAGSNHDELTDIAANSGVSFLIGTPTPIPVGSITGPTACVLMDGIIPVVGIPNPAGPTPLRCGSGLREGGQIQWLLSSSFTADRSSAPDGSTSYRPSFGGLFNPLLTTAAYGGTGCVTGGKVLLIDGQQNLTGANVLGNQVNNPLVTPGQACAIANPLGNRWNRIPAATITAAD